MSSTSCVLPELKAPLGISDSIARDWFSRLSNAPTWCVQVVRHIASHRSSRSILLDVMGGGLCGSSVVKNQNIFIARWLRHLFETIFSPSESVRRQFQSGAWWKSFRAQLVHCEVHLWTGVKLTRHEMMELPWGNSIHSKAKAWS